MRKHQTLSRWEDFGGCPDNCGNLSTLRYLLKPSLSAKKKKASPALEQSGQVKAPSVAQRTGLNELLM